MLVQEPAYVLALEVLDNLPHDKVVRDNADSPWHETWVEYPPDSQSGASVTEAAHAKLSESRRPVQDHLIRRCMGAADWMAPAPDDGAAPAQPTLFGRIMDSIAGVQRNAHANAASAGEDVLFLPTGALQLFDAMHTARPRHHLIAADFASFAAPEVLLAGRNAPIVSSVVRHTTVTPRHPLP
jgi:Putative S-adenosyl-L-methionine-dependent methyltransferase